MNFELHKTILDNKTIGKITYLLTIASGIVCSILIHYKNTLLLIIWTILSLSLLLIVSSILLYYKLRHNPTTKNRIIHEMAKISLLGMILFFVVIEIGLIYYLITKFI